MKRINETIEIPAKMSVFEDKKTHARTVAFPFDLPNGEHAVLTITKLNPKAWIPSESIKSITLTYAD